MPSWSPTPSDSAVSNGLNRIETEGDWYLCPVGIRGGDPFAFGAPASGPNEYTTVGLRGVTISDLTGTVILEAVQQWA